MQVRIEIDNVMSVLVGWGVPQSIYDEIAQLCAYRPVGWQFASSYGQSWDGYVRLFIPAGRKGTQGRRYRFYTGLLSYVLSALAKYGIWPTIVDAREQPPATQRWELVDVAGEGRGGELWPHQAQAIENGMQVGRGVCEIPTGGGKTVVACGLIARAGVAPSVFWVHTVDLFDQAIQQLETKIADIDAGQKIRVGKVGAGHCEIRDVNVVMVQSAAAAVGGRRSLSKEDRKLVGQEVDKHTTEIKGLLDACRAWIFDECVPPGTPVLMADGTFRPIELVTPDDEIMTADPEDPTQLRAVHPERVFPVEMTEIVRIYTTHGPLFVSPNHICYVIDRSLTLRAKRAVDVQPDDVMMWLNPRLYLPQGTRRDYTEEEMSALPIALQSHPSMSYPVAAPRPELLTREQLEALGFVIEERQRGRTMWWKIKELRNDRLQAVVNACVAEPWRLPLIINGQAIELQRAFWRVWIDTLVERSASQVQPGHSYMRLRRTKGMYTPVAWMWYYLLAPFGVPRPYRDSRFEVTDFVWTLLAQQLLWPLDEFFQDVIRMPYMRPRRTCWAPDRMLRDALAVWGELDAAREVVRDGQKKHTAARRLVGSEPTWFAQMRDKIDPRTPGFRKWAAFERTYIPIIVKSVTVMRAQEWLKAHRIVDDPDAPVYFWAVSVPETRSFFASGWFTHNCQHIAAPMMRRLVRATPNAYYRWAVSATPYREDGADLFIEALTGPKFYSISPPELQRQSRLADDAIVPRSMVVPPRIFVIPVTSQITGVSDRAVKGSGGSRRGAEAYARTYKRWVHNDGRNALIAKIARFLTRRGKTVAILVSHIPHGRALQALIPHSEFISGELSRSERLELMRRIRSRELQCLIGTSLVAEGVDIPALDALIIANAQKSAVRTVQAVGRVARVAPNKYGAIVVDLADDVEYLRTAAQRRVRAYRAMGYEVVTGRTENEVWAQLVYAVEQQHVAIQALTEAG